MSDWESLGGELVDYGNAPEFYVDDWDTPVIRNGVLTNAAYRIINGQRIVVLRIAMPALAVAETQRRVDQALHEAEDAPALGFHITDRLKVLS